MNKKGQLTIFIIIAVIIVAIVIVLFWPRIKLFVSPTQSPQSYVEECIKEPVESVLERVMTQGGRLEPENYIMFNDEKVEYLCYTNQYYERCLMQRPLLRQDIENEIKSEISVEVEECFNSMKENMESRGYKVEVGRVIINVELVPENIIVSIDSPVSFIRDDERQSYDSFKTSVKSQAYHLVMIASSIINWETRYGDSDSMTYMLYYPDLKVEKYKQGDGSTVYILTHRKTKEKFMFASRSVAWPAAWGIGETYEK